MNILARICALFGAAALFVNAFAQPKSDWEIKMEERNWTEGELKLPPYPKPENLIEFEASAANPFRFFVDSLSIAAGTGSAKADEFRTTRASSENQRGMVESANWARRALRQVR